MKVNKAKIIDLMCAKDLTQEQLAKGCGVRNCTINKIFFPLLTESDAKYII